MVLLPTAYLPSISYLHQCLRADVIAIERHENFVKSTTRNRCQILTSNGIQTLTIPIVGGRSHKQSIDTTQICYAQNWQKQHWATLISAYNNSPFFEFYAHHFEPFYHQKEFDLLVDFNTKLLAILFQLLKIKTQLAFTDAYHHQPKHLIDHRNKPFETKPATQNNAQYIQVFNEKMPFQANLSVLDLLFCEGNNAKYHLQHWQDGF